MVINKAIKHIMKENKVTNDTMARTTKRASANSVTSILGSKNLTCDKAIEFLEALGYELVVQRKTAGPRSKDQIILERSDQAEEPQK